MISCCSCVVTPNGLISLSARRDLVNNTLTPSVPTSIVVKLVASVPLLGTTCSGSSASWGPDPLPSGMLAWGTTVHAGATPGSDAVVTETQFLPATLSGAPLLPSINIGEARRLQDLCTFINANGSGFGICASCRLGGLGGGRL